MMITKIQLAAMGRVDIPEDDRKDFYLYVDEFQNFATESFANILSEARKYHLNLILANQYVTQIDEKVRDAIFGNAGSIISFRVGAMDAEFLEKEFEPVFMMNDIINLPKYQIYLKLMIDGIAGDAFSATTLPPIKLEDVGNEAKIINSSRERYSSSKIEVEDKIRRWSGMLTPEERQAIADETRKNIHQAPIESLQRGASVSRQGSSVKKQPVKNKPVSVPARSSVVPLSPVSKKTLPQQDQASQTPISPPPMTPKRTPLISFAALEQQEAETQREAAGGTEAAVAEIAPVPSAVPEKTMYPASCASCGVAIEVPFVPDGKRPTFCKDCLRDYQRSVAKARNEIGAKQVAVSKETPPSEPLSSGRVAHQKSYASTDAPMSLAQMQHVGPKKFKALRHRPSVNLDEVRALISGANAKEH